MKTLPLDYHIYPETPFGYTTRSNSEPTELLTIMYRIPLKRIYIPHLGIQNTVRCLHFRFLSSSRVGVFIGACQFLHLFNSCRALSILTMKFLRVLLRASFCAMRVVISERSSLLSFRRRAASSTCSSFCGLVMAIVFCSGDEFPNIGPRKLALALLIRVADRKLGWQAMRCEGDFGGLLGADEHVAVLIEKESSILPGI